MQQKYQAVCGNALSKYSWKIYVTYKMQEPCGREETVRCSVFFLHPMTDCYFASGSES